MEYAKAKIILEAVGILQEAGEAQPICPRCGCDFVTPPVYHPFDSQSGVHLCAACELDEAVHRQLGIPPMPFTGTRSEKLTERKKSHRQKRGCRGGKAMRRKTRLSRRRARRKSHKPGI